MTLEAAELERLQRENRADLAALRAVPDLVELLRPEIMPNGEPLPTVWWLSAEADEDSYPDLIVGIRGDVGFLHWYADDTICEVPAGTEYRDGAQDYDHGGTPHGCNNGEEIPAEQVYAAALEFVATGQRPTCIQWMNEADVPDLTTPSRLEDDPYYKAVSEALGL